MCEHLEDYWFVYLCAVLLCLVVADGVATVHRERAREAYCYERGAVLVQTDGNRYCVPLEALQPVGEDK